MAALRRLAFASSTGLMVDEHFGRSGRFVIIDADPSGWYTVGTRLVPPANAAGNHQQSDFERVATLLNDCDGLFVLKIGPYAAQFLMERGIRVFEASGAVEHVLARLKAEGLLGTEPPQ